MLNPIENAKIVSFEQLISEVGGGLDFTQEELELMMDDIVDKGEDFLVQHKDRAFRIKNAQIKEYFQTHPRPERPKSAQEEINFLKQRLADYEKQVAILKGQKLTPESEVNEPPILNQPPSDSPSIDPQKDKMTMEQIQKMLKKDLENKKPVGRPPKTQGL
jgi:hypothetical protein